MAGALYNLTLSYIHIPHHKFYPIQLADFFIFLTVARSVDFLSQLQASPPEAGKLKAPQTPCSLSSIQSLVTTTDMQCMRFRRETAHVVLLLKIDKHSQGRFWLFCTDD